MIRVKNVQVAVVERAGEKDWESTRRYLSIRTYRDNGQLLMGPDIPITSQHPSDKIEQAMALALEMACGSDYDDGKLAMIAA